MIKKSLFIFIILFCFINSYADDIDRRIIDFWKIIAFNENKYFSNELAEKEDWKKLYDALHSIDSRIDLLILAEILNKKKRLVITAGCNKELFDLIKKIVKNAPVLKYFIPIALHPRLTKFEPFKIDGISLSVEDVIVHFDEPEEGKYELVYILPDKHIGRIESDKSIKMYNVYFDVLYMMTLQVLGEQLMSDKIGGLELYPLNIIMPGIKLKDLYDSLK